MRDIAYTCRHLKQNYLKMEDGFLFARPAGTLVNEKLVIGITVHRARIRMIKHNIYIPFMLYDHDIVLTRIQGYL